MNLKLDPCPFFSGTQGPVLLVLLDGEHARKIFVNESGYDPVSRSKNIKKYMSIVSWLNLFGVSVIVAAINAFEKDRSICREKLKNYKLKFNNRNFIKEFVVETHISAKKIQSKLDVNYSELKTFTSHKNKLQQEINILEGLKVQKTLFRKQINSLKEEIALLNNELEESKNKLLEYDSIATDRDVIINSYTNLYGL